MKHNLIVVITLFLLTSCSNTPKAKPIEGEFVHVVMIWLKDSENKEVRNHFEEALETMTKNSLYINSVHFGSPANTPRDIVDNTYTYCYIATFFSKEDQDKYQTEKAHEIFREEIDGLIDKIVIYDSLTQW